LKRHIPNTFTCLNLFTGCIAAVLIFHGKDYTTAAYLVFVCAFFDLLDGMTARMLKEYSWYGKELDSLADVVSFGFIPGAIMYSLLTQTEMTGVILYFPFIITIFSALRLAKFIKDLRQSTSFIGLPTPANTLLIVSLPLIVENDAFGLSSLILTPWFLIGLSAFQSYLLVAEIPLFALKFTTLSWKENKYQYILLICAIVLLITLRYAAIPLIVLLYVLLSLIRRALGDGEPVPPNPNKRSKKIKK
jgi:CDP-diacylglycerol--serine O-phosphatidyltransferase